MALSLADVKAWSKITTTTEDALIQRVLDAVVDRAETDYDLPIAYTPSIEQALSMAVARLWKRRDTPEGVSAFADAGVIRVGSFDADVDNLLAPWRRWAVA